MVSGTNASVAVSAAGATIAGGTSSLVLNSAGGATFRGAGGAPLTVTGVANGSSTYDAVNFGQVKDLEKLLSRGISSATALANIPQVDTSKMFAVGAGVASFNGETAFAIGASARVGGSGVIKASVGSGSGSGKAAYGLGGGWSF
jgi:autotransporter adhesin